MPRSRYRIGETEYPYFLTCTVVAWLPVFTRPEAVQIVLDCWDFLRQNREFVLYG
jgi:putative transposase